jgi:predicted ester cyclase
LLGIAATGRRVEYTGMLVRLEGKRIAESWAQPDQLGLLKQLGARVTGGETAATGASGDHP